MDDYTTILFSINLVITLPLLIYQYFEVSGTGKFLNIKQKNKRKNPALALVLNLFFLIFGLGYLYLGEWKRFVYYFIGWQLLFLNPYFFKTGYYIIIFFIWVFTLFDVLQRAELGNYKIENRRTIYLKDSRSWARYIYPIIIIVSFIYGTMLESGELALK